MSIRHQKLTIIGQESVFWNSAMVIWCKNASHLYSLQNHIYSLKLRIRENNRNIQSKLLLSIISEVVWGSSASCCQEVIFVLALSHVMHPKDIYSFNNKYLLRICYLPDTVLYPKDSPWTSVCRLALRREQTVIIEWEMCSSQG